MNGSALLVLEDGKVYEGEPWGKLGQTMGEIVFNTGMTGYQETLTDPSYRRQIVVMTAPHIGNTGVNDEDPESRRIWVAGFVARDPSRRTSSWRATGSLDEDLVKWGIVGICGVDTRAIVRHLRQAGVMRAGIFSGTALQDQSGRTMPHEDLVEQVRQSAPMVGADLAGEVTIEAPETIKPIGAKRATVVAVDLGIKAMTPHRLAERGAEVHVVPRDTPFQVVADLKPDGVFFSNGPGDPAAATIEVELARAVLDAGLPLFGICYGNQILGRALGFGTYKLRFGHRGLNQPVKDLATGKVEITSHNHGFAVDVPVGSPVLAPHDGGRYGRVEVTHIDLNDGVVEGIRCLDRPAFAVQYHPEAAAGTHDASYLFDRFMDMIAPAQQSTPASR
ncbi:MAG: glutamine-hydrolyzing carbamoyl-phosphate synthase small subunit [Bifidobacteriaceae bacterium]|jgi:carbamoyl-phosphate synthase small subunit|nr:glutamine-hydrolyzing carbamoyl-phosphate synthase small subunit [Bifidobacteriaceae bacterium]